MRNNSRNTEVRTRREESKIWRRRKGKRKEIEKENVDRESERDREEIKRGGIRRKGKTHSKQGKPSKKARKE